MLSYIITLFFFSLPKKEPKKSRLANKNVKNTTETPATDENNSSSCRRSQTDFHPSASTASLIFNIIIQKAILIPIKEDIMKPSVKPNILTVCPKTFRTLLDE